MQVKEAVFLPLFDSEYRIVSGEGVTLVPRRST